MITKECCFQSFKVQVACQECAFIQPLSRDGPSQLVCGGWLDVNLASFPRFSSCNTGNELPAWVGLPGSHGKDLHAWLSQDVFPAARVLLCFSSKSKQLLGLSVVHAWPMSYSVVEFLQVFSSNFFIHRNDIWWNVVDGAVIFTSGVFQV